MTLYVAPIVEGQTEDGAIEKLLNRIWKDLVAAPDVLVVLPPTRGGRDAMIDVNHGELTKKIGQAHAKLAQKLNRPGAAPAAGMILLVIDAENQCPAELGPQLQQRADLLTPGSRIRCVVPKKMFENWIVAGAATLGGFNELPETLPEPEDVESEHGAGWLEGQLRSRNANRKYKKTVDAQEFVKKICLRDCYRKSRSFRKLCKELQSLRPVAPPEEARLTGAAAPQSTRT